MVFPKNGEEISEENKQKWIEQNRIRDAFFDICERKPIGLSFDGQSFTLETLDDFKDKLLELRKEGYNFPDYVFEDIENEKSQIDMKK